MAEPTINVIRNVDARPVEVTCREGELVAIVPPESSLVMRYRCEDVEAMIGRGYALATQRDLDAEREHQFERITAEARDAKAARDRSEYVMLFGAVGGAIALAVALDWYFKRRKAKA